MISALGLALNSEQEVDLCQGINSSLGLLTI